MSGKLAGAFKGIDEAIGQIDGAVREAGDTVNAARGQMHHVPLISAGVVEAVARARERVFAFAEVLERRRVAGGIAAGLVVLMLLANLGRLAAASLRRYLPYSPPQKKRRRR